MEAQDFKPKVQVPVLSVSGAVARNKFERMAEIQRAAKTAANLRNEHEDKLLLQNGDGLMVTAKL